MSVPSTNAWSTVIPCATLDFDKSHLVARIDQLASRDLIARAQDLADRRRNQIALTAAGQELIDRLRPVARESQHGFLRALLPAEQEASISLLRRVLDANDAARLTATEEPSTRPHSHDGRAPAR